MSKISLALGGMAVAVLLACLAGCGGPAVDAAEEGAAGEDGQTHLVAVDAFVPERTDLQRTTTQPATVHAWYEARVFAKVSGYLDELRADIGQKVEAGDVLAVVAVPELAGQRHTKLASIQRLKADEHRAQAELSVAEAGAVSYEARLDQAQADLGKVAARLKAAEVALQRVRDLVGQKAVADKLLDEMEAKYEAAKAERIAAEAAISAADAELQLKKAEVQAAEAARDTSRAMIEVAQRELDELDVMLQYAHLTSPFEGVVTERNVDVGDLVRNAQNSSNDRDLPLFVVVQIDKLRVRVTLPERDAPLVNVGDAARITLQALPGETLEGKVSRISGVVDENTRTMMVEIDLPNDERKLLPGMFGETTITLDAHADNLTLPASAVRYDEHGRGFVYIVDANNEVQVVEVTTGLDDGKRIEITGGLSGNERVAGATIGRLPLGQKVHIEK